MPSPAPLSFADQILLEHRRARELDRLLAESSGMPAPYRGPQLAPDPGPALPAPKSLGGAMMRANTAGVQRGLGGAAEMWGGLFPDDAAARWGAEMSARAQQSSAQAHADDPNRGFLTKGLVGAAENLPSTLPSYLGGVLGGPAGYFLGNMAAAPSIYSGTKGDTGTRMDSTAVQSVIEGIDPTAWLLGKTGIPPLGKAAMAYLGNTAAETLQEPAQKLAGEKIESGVPLSFDTWRRSKEEALGALPTTAVMGIIPGLAGAVPQQQVSRGTQGELDLGPGRSPRQLNIKAPVIGGLVSTRHNSTIGKETGVGSSTRPVDGKSVKDGYVVGIAPDRTMVVPGLDVNPQDAADFLAKNWDMYQNDPNLVLGTWGHEGNTYYDVSAVVPTLDSAMKLARDGGEIAIWNAKEKREILTDWGKAPYQGTLPFDTPDAPLSVEQPVNWMSYKQPGTAVVGMQSAVPGGHNVKVYPSRKGVVVENHGSKLGVFPTWEAAQARAEQLITSLPTPKNQPPTSNLQAQPPQPRMPATPPQSLPPRPVPPVAPARPVVDRSGPEAQMLAAAQNEAEARLSGRPDLPTAGAYATSTGTLAGAIPEPVQAALAPAKMPDSGYGFPVWDFIGGDRLIQLPAATDAMGLPASGSQHRRLNSVINDIQAPGHTVSVWSRLAKQDPQFVNVMTSRAVSAFYGDWGAAAMLQMAQANETNPDAQILLHQLIGVSTPSPYAVAGVTNNADGPQGSLFSQGEAPPLLTPTRGRTPEIDQTYQNFREANIRDQVARRQGVLGLGAIPEGTTEQDGLDHLFGAKPFGGLGVSQPGARQYLKTDRAPFAKILAAPETEQRLIELADKGKDVGVGWWDTSGVSKDYGHEWPVFAQMWAAANQMNAPDTAYKIASMHFQDYKQWKAAGADPANIEQYFRPTPLPGYGSVAQKDIRRNAMQIATGQGMNPSEEKLTSMAANVMGDMDPATIDRWIVRAIYGPTDWSTMTNAEGKKVPESLSREQYGSAEQLIQQAAAKAGMSPADFQASVWVGAMRKALESGWRGARNTSLAGANDQYQTRVDKTAAELGISPEEVRRQAANGELVLRQGIRPMDNIQANPAPMPDLPEARLVPPEPGPQGVLPMEMPPVEKRSYPMRTPDGNLVLAANEAPTALRVRPGSRRWDKLTITHPQQMASTSRYLEDETVEHMLFAYTKNGKVVGTDMLTDNDVASVEMRNGLDFVKDSLQVLGADKVYALHNHPSGIASFSGEQGGGGDVAVAAGLQNMLGDKLGGFSIVAGDTGRASHLDLTGRTIKRDTNRFSWDRPSERTRLKGFIPSPLIGMPITGSHDVAAVVDGVEKQYGPVRGMDGGLLMFRDGNGLLIGVETATPEQLADPKYIKDRKAEHGGAAMAYLGKDDTLNMVQRGNPHSFLDILSPNKESVQGLGFRMSVGQPEQLPLGIEQGDTVPYNPEQAPTLEQKAGQAVAGDSRELTSMAQSLAESTRQDWELAKRGVVPHTEQQNVGIALAERTGFNVDEVKEILAKGGTPASEGLVAAAITSRVELSRAVQSQTPEEFAQHLANAGNMMIAARAQASEFGRALGHWGWMQRGGSMEQMVQASQEGTEIARNVLDGKDQLTPEMLIEKLGGPDEFEYMRQGLRTAMENGTLDLDNISAAFNAHMASTLRAKKRGKIRQVGDMPLEWFRAMILTGPATHQVNLTSTALNIAMRDFLVNPVAAGVNVFTKAPDQPGFRDQGRGLQTMLRGVSDVGALAKFGLFSEYPAQQMVQMAHATPVQQQEMLALGEDKWRREAQRAIPGAVGRVVRNVGFAPLSAEDSANRALVLNYEIGAEMSRRGVEWDGKSKVPTDVMSAAMDRAEELTFNKRLGEFGQWVGGLVRKSYVGSWAIPFTTTMQNIIKEGVSYVPGANLALTQYREDLATPHSRAQNEAIAKMVVGTSLFALVAQLRGDPDDPDKYLTAPAPKDWRKRNIWYLENGNLAINTPKGQYEISRMEPLNIILGSMIGAVDAYNDKDKTAAARAANAAMAMASTPLNAHFMMTVGDMVNAFGDAGDENPFQGRRFDSWLARTGAAMTLPQFTYQAAQFNDPWMRQADRASYTEQLKMRMPGLRETLPQRLDIRGQPTPEAKYRDIFPGIQRKEPGANDPLARQLLQWDQGMGLPKNYDEMTQEQKQAYLSYRWNTLSEWMKDTAKRGKPMTLDEYQSALRSFNSRKQTADVRNGDIEKAKDVPAMTSNLTERLGLETTPDVKTAAPAPEPKKRKPAAPKPPKLTPLQKLDIAGGSADQRKDPLTQTLSRAKIGLVVPAWTKQLDAAERDDILSDRWMMMQEAVADLPEDADVLEVQTRIAKAKAKWSKKWKDRRDALKNGEP